VISRGMSFAAGFAIFGTFGLTVAALPNEGPRVLPDDALTPGAVATTDQAEVCGYVGGLSYSQRHRQTTPEMKAEVRRRYGMAQCGEIDHRLLLALGGADTIENLWCQPGPPTAWNYQVKDRLGVYVWRAVCKTHSMTLAEGQAVFLRPDWRDEYCTLIGGSPCAK